MTVTDAEIKFDTSSRANLFSRGNNYKLLNQSFHYDARKYCFFARIVNIWNSLPNDVVDVKARLDKFWMHQDVKFDFTADLTGIGDRSVRVISLCNFSSIHNSSYPSRSTSTLN